MCVRFFRIRFFYHDLNGLFLIIRPSVTKLIGHASETRENIANFRDGVTIKGSFKACQKLITCLRNMIKANPTFCRDLQDSHSLLVDLIFHSCARRKLTQYIRVLFSHIENFVFLKGFFCVTVHPRKYLKEDKIVGIKFDFY